MLALLLILLEPHAAFGGFSAAVGRETDKVDDDVFGIPPFMCEKLLPSCRCLRESSVVSDELQLQFTGTTVQCTKSLPGQGSEYFVALKSMLDVYQSRSPSVNRLDLSSTNLRNVKLSGMFSSVKMKVLTLNGNPISELRGWYFSLMSAEFVQMRHTDLKKLSRVSNLGIRNLKGLDLSFNEIKTIDSDAFYRSNLRHLNLSGNQHLQFYAEMFSGLESHLESIDLSATNLRTVPIAFQAFTKLRYFFLQHNQITRIEASEMRLFPLLQNTIYHFEHNHVRWIDPDAFLFHEMPFILYADDNQISDLSFLHKHDPCTFLDVGVSLRQNDVYCGCNLLKFLAYNTAVVEGKCAYPSILRNLDFRHFERRSFLEELFRDPYFAALEHRCLTEMTKNDTFADCRCKQIEVINSFLVTDEEVRNCTSEATTLRLPHYLLCVLLVLVTYFDELLRS